MAKSQENKATTQVRSQMAKADDHSEAKGQATNSPAEGGSEPSATVPDTNQAPATMKKGAYVVAHLYVEGEDAPAHDFTITALDGVKALFSAGVKAGATPLKISLKKLAVDDDPADEDEAG